MVNSFFAILLSIFCLSSITISKNLNASSNSQVFYCEIQGYKGWADIEANRIKEQNYKFTPGEVEVSLKDFCAFYKKRNVSKPQCSEDKIMTDRRFCFAATHLDYNTGIAEWKNGFRFKEDELSNNLFNKNDLINEAKKRNLSLKDCIIKSGRLDILKKHNELKSKTVTLVLSEELTNFRVNLSNSTNLGNAVLLKDTYLCEVPVSLTCPWNKGVALIKKDENLKVIDVITNPYGYQHKSTYRVETLYVDANEQGKGYIGLEFFKFDNELIEILQKHFSATKSSSITKNNAITKNLTYLCKSPLSNKGYCQKPYKSEQIGFLTLGEFLKIKNDKVFKNNSIKVEYEGKIGYVNKSDLILYKPNDVTYDDENNSYYVENKSSNTETGKNTKEIIIPKNIDEISNNDNSGPIINCNQTEYRTIENFIKLNCQIKDDSEIYKVFVNGKEIKNNLNNFEFKIDNIPLDSSTYEIIAFDIMANQSQQIISVQRDFNYAFVDLENNLEPLVSGKIKHKNSSNRIALIIGIKSYQDIPNTQFGDKDAMVFVDFARENLNIEESNIKYLFNEDARFFEIKKLNQWLKSKINSKTEVFIFYSGHGANNEGESLILPSDFSPDLIADSSFTKKGFLNDMVNQYNPNHIFAFFDACFSGLGREGETLIAGLRNITIAEEEVINDNITVFNSASGAEFSNDLYDAKHGLFSYYLMKGLEGDADDNNDRKITSNELYSFIQNNVSNKAIEIGRKQNPSYIGDSDRVILEW